MTTTAHATAQKELDKGNLNTVADILRKLKLGTMLTPLKRTFTGLTGAATYNLTALDASGESTGASNPNRLPALAVRSLRVTAATTATVAGSYIITDAGGDVLTPATHTAVGVALLSDDGKTLTFPSADVTAFVIQYVPRPAIDMTAVDDALDAAP